MTHGPTTPYASSYEDGYPGMGGSARSSSPEAPSIERGNKLLAFQPSNCNYAVLDCSMRQSTLSLAAQLHGMFFLAESSRTLTGELASSPAELTCYRRNLFQITGSVTLPRLMQYVINDKGERLPIVSQELTISATESVEGSPVKIISVPWKTPANGTPPAPEEKVEKEPSSIPLDQSANHDVDSEFSVFPIAWKRLQFRVATANNGRRRELQQHFTIKLSVVATLSDGSKLPLCDALSGPIIVRGRSPRNFQQRKDVPLSGSGVSMRKTMSGSPAAMARSSTLDSVPRSTPKLEATVGEVYGLSPGDALRRGSPTPSGSEWYQPPMSPFAGSMPDLSTPPRSSNLKRKAEEAGLTLSVPTSNEAYSGRNSAPPGDRPHKLARSRSNTGPGGHLYSPGPTSGAVPGSVPPTQSHFPYSPLPSATLNGHFPKSAGFEQPELLHEYFPTGFDDWNTTPDAVFRPHAVTHGMPVASVGAYFEQ